MAPESTTGNTGAPAAGSADAIYLNPNLTAPQMSPAAPATSLAAPMIQTADPALFMTPVQTAVGTMFQENVAAAADQKEIRDQMKAFINALNLTNDRLEELANKEDDAASTISRLSDALIAGGGGPDQKTPSNPTKGKGPDHLREVDWSGKGGWGQDNSWDKNIVSNSNSYHQEHHTRNFDWQDRPRNLEEKSY